MTSKAKESKTEKRPKQPEKRNEREFSGMIEGSSMHGKGEVAPGFFSDVSRHRATVRSFMLDFCMLAAT